MVLGAIITTLAIGIGVWFISGRKANELAKSVEESVDSEKDKA